MKTSGITLIALVVTIVVLIILATISINVVLGENGIIKRAESARQYQLNAVASDEEVMGILYNELVSESGEKSDNEEEMVIHSWERSEDTFTCSHCNVTYTMGDTVNYIASGKASTTITAEKSGLADYYLKKSKYPTQSDVDENGNQTIEAQDVEWIVLGIEDTDEDEIYETLLITTKSEIKVKSEDEVEGIQQLYLYGATGYNNSVEEINRICKELYSNSEYGEARGITLKDVNNALRYTPYGGLYYGSSYYKTTGNLTTKLKELPQEYWNNLITKGTNTPDPTDEDSEVNLGKYELNGYSYWLNDERTAIEDDINDSTSGITAVERNTIFGESSSDSYWYWLADRIVTGWYEYAQFGVALVRYDYAGYFVGLFFSDDRSWGYDEDYYCGHLRPVVSLANKLPEKK